MRQDSTRSARVRFPFRPVWPDRWLYPIVPALKYGSVNLGGDTPRHTRGYVRQQCPFRCVLVPRYIGYMGLVLSRPRTIQRAPALCKNRQAHNLEHHVVTTGVLQDSSWLQVAGFGQEEQTNDKILLQLRFYFTPS